MGSDDVFPCFLDIEASSFAEDSYPIEVAWSDLKGEIHRYLIKPDEVPDWTDWAASAETAHGIDRERLSRNGWAPDYVAARIEEDLTGEVVYTDAPDYDERWLARLFQAVGHPLPCRFEHVDELLLEVLRQPDEMAWQGVVRIQALKDELQQKMSGKHSAGYDVGYLLQLYRRANGHQVKMNHGAGPLPKASPTGTFMKLKLDQIEDVTRRDRR